MSDWLLKLTVRSAGPLSGSATNPASTVTVAVGLGSGEGSGVAGPVTETRSGRVRLLLPSGPLAVKVTV